MRKRNLSRERRRNKKVGRNCKKRKEQQDKKKELEKIERMIGVCRNHLDVVDGIADLETLHLKLSFLAGK